MTARCSDRVPLPDKEIVTLADYRQRHAQYKRDADLQAAHRQHPFICVWDDHEITNDAWKDGAENHNPELGEGEYSVRKRAGIRAYFEWMPIREWAHRPNERIFRQFRFGELADLMMLDTRHYGRDQQSPVPPLSPTAGFPANDPVINDPGRTLLGFDQEAWLQERLSLSQSRGATWRLLGQQIMMAQLSAERRPDAVQSRPVGRLSSGAATAVRRHPRQRREQRRRADGRHPHVLGQ